MLTNHVIELPDTPPLVPIVDRYDCNGRLPSCSPSRALTTFGATSR